MVPTYFGLNEGTYCSQKCIEVLKSFDKTSSLRCYSHQDNKPLLEAISSIYRIPVENIFLDNGSGPLLKNVIPHIIQQEIKGSLRRIARHLWDAKGYPIICTSMTYGKVPPKALARGLGVIPIPLEAEKDFRLDMGLLRKELKKRDGVVYLVNPNNPTGNILFTRSEIEAVIVEFPRSVFWIDEAYVQYIDQDKWEDLSTLVLKYPNVAISRSLSFAYGLAGLHIGYMLGNKELVSQMNKITTGYGISHVGELVAMEALKDFDHLKFVQHKTKEARDLLGAAIESTFPYMKVFPSVTNFFYVRIYKEKITAEDRKNGRDFETATQFRNHMAQFGISVRTFEPLMHYEFPCDFRITIGLPEENEFFISKLKHTKKLPPAKL